MWFFSLVVGRQTGCRRLLTCRLSVECLEARLPPGDWLLGALLGSTLLGPSLLARDATATDIAPTDDLSADHRTTSPAKWSTLGADNSSSLALAPAPLRFKGEPAEQRGNGVTLSAQITAGNNDDSLQSATSTPWRMDGLLESVFGGSLPGIGRFGNGLKPGGQPATSGGEGMSGVGAGASSSAQGHLIAAGLGMPTPGAITAGNSGVTDAALSYYAASLTRERGVHAGFDLSSVTGGPFASDRWTVADPTQNTRRRVNLPLPDSATHLSDYQDTQVLNTLDGFNLQPRMSIPFDGPIDVNSVNSNTVFLVSLGDTLNPHDHGGQVVGINQVVWDPATNTLHAQSDQVLDQHTRYALIVTDGVQDLNGHPVAASEGFRHFRQDLAHTHDPVLKFYRGELLDAVHAARDVGVRERDIVTASVFTTESATAVLEKIRDQIHAATPAAADFNLGPGGSRTVFALDDLAGITFNEQVGTNPDKFNPVNVNLNLVRNIPGAVGEIAFGKYLSPDYEVHPGEYIPPVATRTGTPVVQSMNDIYFNLFLPSGPEPAGGWPVMIFGIGTGNDKNQTPLFVAATLAEHGIATIAINAVGHGFGPQSTLTVHQTAGNSVTFMEGGRAIDQNGDHAFDNPEGSDAAGAQSIIRDTDGLRQTDADLMQLVREIEVGIDVHGTGSRDLDPSRIYYLGYSRGAGYGTPFLAVEPGVQAGVLNGGGGPRVDLLRLSVGFRNTVAAPLAARTPSLVNAPGITSIDGFAYSGPFFDENMPLKDGLPLRVGLADGTTRIIQSPVINTVPGAMAIQEVLDNIAWVAQSANPVAYAPHLRQDPLAGVPAKSVIIQIAKGDPIDPNPAATAMLRAGDLADRLTYYRNDLAFAEDPTVGKNPHQFMLHAELPGLAGMIARGAQEQIATFFETDGQDVIQPEPAPFFETPIQGPLPEDLNYIL
jgi:Bacterial virulence factor lipase N-terminal